MPSDNEDAMRLEALGDLRRCLELAEEIDDLEVVEGADPDLEIGALYEISLEKEDPPVLVFDKIKGYPPGFRVAVNVRSSQVFASGEGLERVESYRKHRRQHAEPIEPVTVGEPPPSTAPRPLCCGCSATSRPRSSKRSKIPITAGRDKTRPAFLFHP